MKQTNNYGFPQCEANDKGGWLTTFNESMRDIDVAIKTVDDFAHGIQTGGMTPEQIERLNTAYTLANNAYITGHTVIFNNKPKTEPFTIEEAGVYNIELNTTESGGGLITISISDVNGLITRDSSYFTSGINLQTSLCLPLSAGTYNVGCNISTATYNVTKLS